ncbi:hypothetical protein [Halopiger xanaduensis]|uniref:hypothetical protein n=1 Tax=Halopiger xanaduensis TaxID=387343 RepID=UPI0011D2B528|nr:hypothetical protein [Halopiger xanaduensis]
MVDVVEITTVLPVNHIPVIDIDTTGISDGNSDAVEDSYVVIVGCGCVCPSVVVKNADAETVPVVKSS